MDEVVKQVKCQSAEELLDALSPWGKFDIFGTKECGVAEVAGSRDYLNVFLFRGHSDTSYELAPTALRRTNNLLEKFYHSKPEHGVGAAGHGVGASQTRSDAAFNILHSGGLCRPSPARGLAGTQREDGRPK